MSASLDSVTIRVIPDEDPDPSYLDQEEFADRLAAYRRGEFAFVGVRLVAEIKIPHGKGWIMQDIESPGLWGIEDDSGEDYYRSVAEDEAHTLRDMLAELGITDAVEIDSTTPLRY